MLKPSKSKYNHFTVKQKCREAIAVRLFDAGRAELNITANPNVFATTYIYNEIGNYVLPPKRLSDCFDGENVCASKAVLSNTCSVIKAACLSKVLSSLFSFKKVKKLGLKTNPTTLRCLASNYFYCTINFSVCVMPFISFIFTQ